ncbi:hypothetical protein CTheo_8137 [Ceratobasidium theobromae]|uniref:Uncharacterized protein n=1 Tax=Ceratobasidium theobromae TaxID=1582974 RepID=A0A5N5Q9T8_9AGAM|nr:hypothetical protein CTheo_8137 [Ceratobasidium theobromae]
MPSEHSFIEKYLTFRMLFADDTDDEYVQLLRQNITLITLYIIDQYEDGQRRQRKRVRGGYYLRRAELMPSPRIESGWLAVYRSQEDRTYINTMGVDVATFNFLLTAGFKHA